MCWCRWRLWLAAVWLVLAAADGWAAGQSAVDGAMRGTVVDATGRVVVGAAVEITAESTGARVRVRTGARGEFLAVHLVPGSYRVVVRAAGFAEAVAAGVPVEVGGVAEVAERLAVGAVAEQVTVTADDAPGAATSASVISSRELGELPVDGRRWQSLAALLPQVNPDVESAETGLVSFRGLAPTQNSSQIDGVSSDQSYNATPQGSGEDSSSEADEDGETGTLRSFSAGADRGRKPGAAYTFTESAVREFRVTGQNGSALEGHAAGGVITTVSRSGGNALHGTAFFLGRDSAWAATNPFATVTTFRDGVVNTTYAKPHDLRQQFGGSVGGPVRHDRLFFFYAFDEQRRGFPAISSPEDPNFYALTPTQRALLGNRGVRASAVTAALNYLDSLTGVVARRADQTVNFAKLDWTPRATERLSVEENRARSSSPAGLRTAPVVSRGRASFGDSTIKVDSLVGRWAWLGSARVSNEVRVQIGRDLHEEQPETPLAQEPAIGPGGFAPEVDIGPLGLIFGTPASISQGPSPDERRVQVTEAVTLSLGRHLLQIGADWSHVHDRVELLPDAEGLFHYDSGVTNGHAGGLVDWITDYTFGVNSYPNGGCPSITATVHYSCFRSFTQSFGSRGTAFSTAEWAGYVQDDWRARPGLTLGIGMRYEYEFLPLPQQPNGALDTLFGGVGATSVFPEDRNNFGPRVSAAWEPFGRRGGTVRVAYGVYYGRLAGATVRSALVNTATASSVTRIRILPTTETACPQVNGQGFGYPCAFVATPPTGVAATTSAEVFDRRFRLPMTQQATLAVEQPLGRGLTASASYLLDLNRQLPNSVDINIAPATATRSYVLQGGTGAPGVRDGEGFTVPLYTSRVSTRFGPVTDIVSNANGTYNALAVEAREHTRGGLDVRVSFTWSKAIDFGQSAGAVPPADGQFDPFEVRYDKGLSAFNVPHRLVASGVWAPKVERGSALRRGALGSWSVAPVVTESSGRPYSYEIFGGTRLPGGRESINGSGGLTYLPTVGRDVLRLPDTAKVDVRLSRGVRLGERARLRAFAEVFNVANHVNVSSVSQRAFLLGTPVNGVTPLLFQDATAVAGEGLNVQPFGTRTESAAAAQERQVQVGVRVEF